MKQFWTFVLVIVVLAVAVVLVLASMKPDTMSVQRSVSIKASPEKIMPLIADFHNWDAWFPYMPMIPAESRTYSGAAMGKGAIFQWQGGKAGMGRMEITDAMPGKVMIQNNFEKPMKTQNTFEFDLAPAGDMTNVTWVMSGSNSFMYKIMEVFMDMGKMTGKGFEDGLAKMKVAAEK